MKMYAIECVDVNFLKEHAQYEEELEVLHDELFPNEDDMTKENILVCENQLLSKKWYIPNVGEWENTDSLYVDEFVHDLKKVNGVSKSIIKKLDIPFDYELVEVPHD